MVSVNQGAANIVKSTATAASAATTNSVSIAGSVAQVWVIGVEPWLSTTKRVRVANVGVPGSTTANWNYAGTYGVYGPLMAIKQYAPDLTIISLGINDAYQQVAAGTVQTNLAAIIAAAQVSGDVILMTMPPSSGANYTTYEPLYQPVYSALSNGSGLPLVDIFGRFKSTWQTALMFDGQHPNDYGYWDMAGAVDVLLRNIQ